MKNESGAELSFVCFFTLLGSLIQLVEQNGGNLHVTVKQTYFNFILVVGANLS